VTKYIVKIKEVHAQHITVEAENEQAAAAAAEEVLASGVNQDGTDLNDEVVYDHTLDRNEWNVWKAWEA
jgi:hypothetical protein